jgi:uncharacterized protein (TIGR03437 family)
MRIFFTTTIFVLGCAASLGAAPAITGVTNSAGNVPIGLPNSGIAQGSIFVVYGSGLGPSELVEVSTYPLPTTQGLAGTTATVTVGSTTETCIMFYTVSGQVAAILPSATPTGTGTLKVTYQGQSASTPITVTAAGFNTYAANNVGSGPAVVTDANFNVITMVNPAYPGETLILWGTGLGAVNGDETEPPMQYDLGTGVQVFVENQPATVLYGGRSGDAGLDQINFTVPLGISGGCRTSIAVLEKGVASNVTTMAVAPQGQSTCGDPFGLLTLASMQKALATGTLNTAEIALNRFSNENDVVSGSFLSYPLATLTRSYGGSGGASIGSCTAYELQGSSVFADPVQPPGVDAGSTLTIIGPEGTKNVAENPTGTYDATLGGAGSYIVPGVFSVSNGSKGPSVGAFNVGLTLPPPVTFTNFPATVNRAQDLTLTWTNSTAFSVVSIFGVSGVPVSSTKTNYVEFFCTANAATGQFTIPSAVLSLLPANGYGAVEEPGVGLQISGITVNHFTVTGIDTALFSAFTYNGGVAKLQ